MKRVREIRINGRSGLNARVSVVMNPLGVLTKCEQDRVLEALTDHLHAACLLDVPYHSVHASDVTIR